MLNINGTLIAIVINFIILVYALKYFLYEPVMKIIGERKSHVDRMLSEASAKLSSAEAFMADGRDAINKANVTARTMIEDASGAAEKIRKDSLIKAKKEMDEHKERAKEEIRQLKLDARKSIVNEAARLSVVIAEKIIMKKIDRKTQKAMTESFIERVKN